MNHLARICVLSLLLLAFFALPARTAFTLSISQDPKPQEPAQKGERDLGIRPGAPKATPDQTKPGASKPEIVLQAGITSPQSQISFSPDGRLLASMGMNGNAIKLWEVASGRLLRQLDSGIPSMGATSMTRPFRFSPDGLTLLAIADGRLRRWEVETGRELSSTVLPAAKDLIVALLSDDGRILAGSSLNSTVVRLWDTSAGRELRAVAFENEWVTDT